MHYYLTFNHYSSIIYYITQVLKEWGKCELYDSLVFFYTSVSCLFILSLCGHSQWWVGEFEFDFIIDLKWVLSGNGSCAWIRISIRVQSLSRVCAVRKFYLFEKCLKTLFKHLTKLCLQVNYARFYNFYTKHQNYIFYLNKHRSNI